MKHCLIIVFILTVAFLSAEPISQDILIAVYLIGDEIGVPRSVIRQLMIEESGDPRAGTLGDPKAVSRVKARGFNSRGLFQLYEEPKHLSYLLRLYWSEKPEEFNIEDPLHNATVALKYLAALHARLGTWYNACVYYNAGRIEGAPESTKAYARRIVTAPLQ